MYSPWVIFSKQIEKLFERDPEIKLEFNDDRTEIKLRVDNPEKADALSRILPTKKKFGNVEVKITVIPSNDESYRAKYVKKAFEGNGAFSHFKTVSDIPGVHISNPISYCVFKKEVVQYGADDLGSESGMTSTLYEDLAAEILGPIDGVYFCTDIKDEKPKINFSDVLIF